MAKTIESKCPLKGEDGKCKHPYAKTLEKVYCPRIYETCGHFIADRQEKDRRIHQRQRERLRRYMKTGEVQ